MENTMKFYFNPVSGPCRKAYIVALHLGVALDEKFMDFAKQDHKSPEYMKINPNGKIPTLVDGDFVLWESNAICQYLCTKKAGQTLWPADARIQADIARWMFWQSAHFSSAISPFAWENFLKARMGQGAPDLQRVKDAEPEFHRFAKVLDAHLRGREYLVGKDLTLADIVVGSALIYKDSAKLPISEYKNILDWYARLEKLEAWKKSAPKR